MYLQCICSLSACIYHLLVGRRHHAPGFTWVGRQRKGGLRGGDLLVLSPSASLPGEAGSGGGLREGGTADGSTATQVAVDLHDVRFCSRCEDCSALYPEGGSVGLLFQAVPCMRCGWDTGLEYSDAEVYGYGYGADGGICVACGGRGGRRSLVLMHLHSDACNLLVRTTCHLMGLCADGIAGSDKFKGDSMFKDREYDVCCPAKCGTCSGHGCSFQPGGRHQCCGKAIWKSAPQCSLERQAPCWLPAATPNWCVNGVTDALGAACCKKQCGSCGGAGCSTRLWVGGLAAQTESESSEAFASHQAAWTVCSPSPSPRSP